MSSPFAPSAFVCRLHESDWLAAAFRSRVLVWLGIHADDGQMTSLEAVTQIGEVFKLQVAVGAVAGGDLFVIHAQRIAHLVKQPRHGIGAGAYAKGEEFLGDFGRGAPLGLTSEPPGERGEEAQGVFEEAKMKELAEQLVKMAIWDYLGCIHTISI